MKKHIPNTITLINVFAGCIAIVATIQGNLNYVPYLLIICFAADYLDGLAARALNAKSELGKQLDSLADMVSFGTLPAIIIYVLMKQALYGSTTTGTFFGMELVAFLIAMFAALRLGKFNIDTRQTDSFIGLPTPATTLFVLGILLINQNSEIATLVNLSNNYYFLATITIGLSILMIVELPLLSLKMSSLSFSKYKWQWALAIGSVLLLIIFKINSLPMVIVYYLLVSIAHNQRG
jgi:CDP-diacylglycerol---serine O-phosphatidyltransferase